MGGQATGSVMRLSEISRHKALASLGLIICLIVPCQPRLTHAQSKADAVIDGFITDQKKKHRADEYREARKILRIITHTDYQVSLRVDELLRGEAMSDTYVFSYNAKADANKRTY